MSMKQTGVVNMEGALSKTHRPNNHPSNPIEKKPTKKARNSRCLQSGAKRGAACKHPRCSEGRHHCCRGLGCLCDTPVRCLKNRSIRNAATARMRSQGCLPRNFTASPAARKTKLTIAPRAPGTISAIFLPSVFKPFPMPPATLFSPLKSALTINPIVFPTARARLRL